MKANTDTRMDHDATRPATAWRRRTAIALVGLLGLAACTSDPGPRRVAEDIIEAEFEQGTISESEKDCMLEVLDADYDNSTLEAIAGDFTSSDEATSAEGEAELEQLRADLAACSA